MDKKKKLEEENKRLKALLEQLKNSTDSESDSKDKKPKKKIK